MVDLLAPTVAQLVAQLMPWLSSSAFSSAVSSAHVSHASSPSAPASVISDPEPPPDFTDLFDEEEISEPPPSKSSSDAHDPPPFFPPPSPSDPPLRKGPHGTAHPVHVRPPNAPTPAWKNRIHLNRDYLPDPFHFELDVDIMHLSRYGFELGDNYLVIPDDSFLVAPDPHHLEFRDDADLLFTLTISPRSIDQILPPPDTSSPIGWNRDQTLGLIAHMGEVKYDED
jgi:hypothetical protein